MKVPVGSIRILDEQHKTIRDEGMGSRLDRITDWEERARRVAYQTSTLARDIKTTPRHLQRYFLDRFGMSPRAWLRRMQMIEARQLLASDHRVKETAQQVGFRNATHFSRAFKREHGINPAAYAGQENLI